MCKTPAVPSLVIVMRYWLALIVVAGGGGCTQLLGADWDGRAPEGTLGDGSSPPIEGGSQVEGGADGPDAMSDAGPPAVSGPLGLGTRHTCAVDRAGRVLCWGDATYGQSGGRTGVGAADPSAKVVDFSEKGVAAAAGEYTSFVIGASGAVYSWGDGVFEKLGRTVPPTNGNQNAPKPAKVEGLTEPAVAIAARSSAACAVTASGKVVCWGAGLSGAAGRPAPIQGFAAAAKTVGVGNDHACALLQDQSVGCWGKNDERQLGVDTTEMATTPVPVPLGAKATSIAVGASFGCAILESGSVACWGKNDVGQLGTEAAGLARRATPEPVEGLADIARIAAGDAHACAVSRANRVFCWGNPSYGRVGGTPASTGAVVEVFGISAAIDAIGAGADHSCARTATGAMCWGDNTKGQLGAGGGLLGQTSAAPRPVDRW